MCTLCRLIFIDLQNVWVISAAPCTNRKDTNFKEQVKQKPYIFNAVNFVHSYQCIFVYYTNQMRSIVHLVGIITKYVNHIPYLPISNSASSSTLFIPALSQSFQSDQVYLNTKKIATYVLFINKRIFCVPCVIWFL